MKEAIYNLIKELDDVSFVELTTQIDGFSGNHTMGLNKNTIFWDNTSQEAINALSDLLAAGSIKMMPADVLVYILDGVHLDLPVAQQIGRKYKTPHWVPIVFSVGGPNA
jgi:hypothetical protein